ncbi:MAG TPA: BrnT family toxin [Thermoanaerobaculia bacterium]|nr:BrnT family toxin [Thermoanaerobaculia bacterium]
MRFEWDPSKAAANLRKHDVSFEEAAGAFDDDLSATFPDPDHSFGEARFITYGLGADGKLLVVSYTEREGTIRIVSAREATTKERKRYEA